MKRPDPALILLLMALAVVTVFDTLLALGNGTRIPATLPLCFLLTA